MRSLHTEPFCRRVRRMPNDVISCSLPFTMRNTVWLLVAMATVSVCTIDSEANTSSASSKDSMNMQLFNKTMTERFPHLDINMDKLIHEYISICPYMSVCDNEHIREPQMIVYSRSDVSVKACRPCDCSFKCLEMRNCCPGNAYQYLPYELFNSNVHNGEIVGLHENMVYMIADCPVSYEEDADVISRCRGNNSVLYPVTSFTTKLTYKNRHCAACHKDRDLLFWDLKTHCKIGEKVSPDEVQNSTKCYLRFEIHSRWSSSMHVTAPRVGDSNHVIKTCNVTGLWGKYDPQINWACENMEYLYQNFKNVFCYICNPGLASTQVHPLIDTCNVTGKWVINKTNVRNGCLSQPRSQRLFPYKNIHCLICNGMAEKVVQGKHFNVSIVEKNYPSSIDITFGFNIKNSSLTLGEILSLLSAAGIRPTTVGKLSEKNKLMNVSYVIGEYESICGGSTSCQFEDRAPLPPGKNTRCRSELCTCSSNCAEKKTCCPPVLLKYSPYSCASVLAFPSWKAPASETLSDSKLNGSVVIIDECLPGNKEDRLHSFFKNMSVEGWENIPARTNHYLRITYKNLSYLLCNTAKQTAYIDMELYCNVLIDYSLFISLKGLLQTAKEYCNIRFLSSNARACEQNLNLAGESLIYHRDQFSPISNISQNIKSTIDSAYMVLGNETYSTCNQTKQWATEQTDIKLICEGTSESYDHLLKYHVHGFVYKNFACFICNPVVREDEVDHVISTCNLTGVWDGSNTDMIEQCRNTKYQERWLPFKNFFCSECNLPRLNILWPTRDYTRYLFSISEEEWALLSGVSNKDEWCLTAASNTTEKSCHELFCSPGHILEDGKCVAFYNGEYRKYAISFEMALHTSADDHDIGCPTLNHQRLIIAAKFKRLIDQVADDIVDELDRNGVYSYFYNGSIVESDCDADTHAFNLTAATRIRFSLTCGYRGVNNNEIETLLLEFVNRQYIMNIASDNDILPLCKVPFQVFQILWDRNSQDNDPLTQWKSCYYYRLLPQFYDKNYARPILSETVSVVDRFLRCPQLEFDSNEYLNDNITDSVKILDSRVTFKTGHFKRQGTSIRICLEDYKQKLVHQTKVLVGNSLINAYHLFSNIIIGISLASLALTFATYCMFPCLRTLPGLNIMLLTISLFSAQALLLFTLRLEPNSLICQTMGILIHYSWLATFCAMNICSFHLFKIFYQQTLSQTSSGHDRRRFSYYLLYTLGMPLLIVAATICVYAIPSNGQSVGYGKLLCFLSDVKTSIVAFITPAVLVFLSNIVFFSLAFNKIRTTTKVQAHRKEERQDLAICLKISVLVGVTWPLYLLDSFIGFSYFSFVVEGFNSLQGVFIFLSYVCNKRVLALFKEKINPKPGSNLFSSSP